MSDVIIGAGITGFVAKTFLPDAKIFALGGGVLPSPFIVWKDKYTEKWLAENNIQHKEVDYSIEYIGDNFKKYNALTKKEDENKPCEGKTKIKGFSLSNLPKLDFERKTVTSVEQNVMLGNGFMQTFNKAVWTAPVDETTFDGLSSSAKYYPVSFIQFEDTDSDGENKLVYLLDDEFLDKNIYRATKENGTITFEYFGALDFDNFLPFNRFLHEKFTNLGTIKNEWCNKKAVVEAKSKLTSINKNILFVGRYAQCDHEIKTNDVIKRFYEYQKEGWFD